jgi:hypothetical protein
MTHLKRLGLAAAMTLAATCGVVGSASATTIEPANTAFFMTSTNFSLVVNGAGTVTCSHTQFGGFTPTTGGATWAEVTVSLAFTGCATGGLATTVTPTEGCNTTGSLPTMHYMLPRIMVLTLIKPCHIDIRIPAVGCTLLVTGDQTIGNGTDGAGGMAWTNANPKSKADLNAAVVPDIDSNGAMGCGASGAHTGTMSGNFTLSTATNVTVTAP